VEAQTGAPREEVRKTSCPLIRSVARPWTTGEEILEGTGLYVLGARVYDPETGRFLQPDPLVPNPADPQSFNRYTYALNNPLRWIDPSGLWPEEGPTGGGGGGSVPSADVYPGDNPFPTIPKDFFETWDGGHRQDGGRSQDQGPWQNDLFDFLAGNPFSGLNALAAGPREGAGSQRAEFFSPVSNATDLGVRRGVFAEASFKVYGVIGVNIEVNVASYTASFVNPNRNKFSSGFELSVDVAGAPLGIELFQREISAESVASPLADLFSQPSRSGFIYPLQLRGSGVGVPAEFGRIEGRAGFLIGIDTSLDVKGFFKDALGR